MMTLELAKLLVNETSALPADIQLEVVERVYRRLLQFLTAFSQGSGAVEGGRLEAREYARRNGYFWLPCVLCGRWFGGHESGTGILWLSIGRGCGVCNLPECTAEAKRLQALYPEGINQ